MKGHNDVFSPRCSFLIFSPVPGMNSLRKLCPCGRREILCLIFTSLLSGNMENRFGECRSRQLGEYSGLVWGSAEADSHLPPTNEIESSPTASWELHLQKTMPHRKQLCLAHQAIQASQHQDKPVSGNVIFSSPTDMFVLHLGGKKSAADDGMEAFSIQICCRFLDSICGKSLLPLSPPPSTCTVRFTMNPHRLKCSELWQGRAANGGQQCKLELWEHTAGSWVSDYPGTTDYSFHLEGRETKASLCVPGFCRN